MDIFLAMQMDKFWQILANVATLVAALIALVAAVYARSQSQDAKAQLKEANSQLEFSKQSGRDDDDRRKKTHGDRFGAGVVSHRSTVSDIDHARMPDTNE